MESLGKIAKFSQKKSDKPKINPHLHSPNHLLADELSIKLNDRKHFAFYLKMAVLYNHDFLRNLAGQIMENKNAQTPGRLFAYLIKKHNQEKSASSGSSTEGSY
ncbi:MAG TPA: hypothetical protein VE973_01170 [Candidatus Limnocylindria bacterium]|nr:hypothetical protein [Candidatus Limnocylindria bacterium]